MIARIKEVLEKYKFWVLVIAGVGVFVDTFFFDFSLDLIILALILLWVLSVWLYKFEGRVSIAVALVFLALCPFLLILNKEAVAEKSAIWAYVFLVVGVAQEVVEYRKSKK